MLAAPDARLFREKTSMGGVATVVSAANLHKFIFTSTGLPALADAKVYELWIMGPGGKATGPACWPLSRAVRQRRCWQKGWRQETGSG